MKPWLLVVLAAGCGSVQQSSGDASLMLSTPSRWVPQGSNVTVPFSVTRTSSMAALQVHVTGLPAGVTAADIDIAADGTTGDLAFMATASSTLGSSTDVMVELHDGARILDARPLTIKVSGASGTLDTTFGTGGRRVISLPDPVLSNTTGTASAYWVAQYPSSAGANAGKLVLVGVLVTSGAASNQRRVALVRLGADGTVDTSFGAGLGYVLLNPGDSTDLAVPTAVIDSQGRIVVAAYRVDTSNLCVVYAQRVTADGAVDRTFAAYNALPNGSGCGRPGGLVALPGDKVVIVAQWNNTDGSQLPLLLQLDSDGTPDTTAYQGNVASIRLPPVASGKTMLDPAVVRGDSKGNILIAGAQCAGGWNSPLSACESVVARLKTDGTYDTTFGDTSHPGYSALTFGKTSSPIERFVGMQLDPDGNIYAAGYSEGATTGTLAKFGATGNVDPSFGTSGHIAPQLVGGAQFELGDVAIDAEGRVVVIGFSNNGSPLQVNARYDAHGVLDTSYGNHGFSTTDTQQFDMRSAIVPDGRLVVAGSFPRAGGGYEMTVWRYWP